MRSSAFFTSTCLYSSLIAVFVEIEENVLENDLDGLLDDGGRLLDRRRLLDDGRRSEPAPRVPRPALPASSRTRERAPAQSRARGSTICSVPSSRPPSGDQTPCQLPLNRRAGTRRSRAPHRRSSIRGHDTWIARGLENLFLRRALSTARRRGAPSRSAGAATSRRTLPARGAASPSCRCR